MLSLVFIVSAVVALMQTDNVRAQNSVAVSMSGFTSGADGVRVIGTSGSLTGNALAQVGDFNGDGTNDFVVSAPTMNVNSVSNVGLAALVLGHSGNWAEIDLSTFASGVTTMRIYAGAASLQVGLSVGGAGDVNGDGYDDFLISLPYLSNGGVNFCGAVFVLFGSPGPYSDVILSNSFVAGSVGYAIFGPATTAYLASQRSNTIGLLRDVNGDGLNDFVVSASNAMYLSRGSSGCVWIIFGSNGAPTNIALSSLGSAGVLIAGGAASSDYSGNSIDVVGDFNKDGFPDLLIGAGGVDAVVSGTTRTDCGVSYLLFGSSTFTSRDPDLANFVTGATGVRFVGAAPNDNLGTTVSGAGDVNGDGYADILICAPNAFSADGLVYVVFGRNAPYTADVDMLVFTAGTAGYAVLGSSTLRYVGSSLSRAGDVNQDGFDDVLVASLDGAGRAFILFGSPLVPTSNVTLATSSAYSFTGSANSRLGTSVYGGFDVNGDGIADIMMGAPGATVTPVAGGSQRGNAGAAYIVMGPFVMPTDQPTSAPSAQPSSGPSAHPSVQPSSEPSAQPSSGPSAHPSAQPSSRPSGQPSAVPSMVPSSQPSSQPSSNPTVVPSAQPSAGPSTQPSSLPSCQPSSLPTARPSVQPTRQPSSEPTAQPSSLPTSQPSAQPSSVPTHSAAPTAVPTATPSTVAGDSSSPVLSDGGIAGVAVGGFLFLLLLIIAIVLGMRYCCLQQGAATPAPAAEYEMTQMQEA